MQVVVVGATGATGRLLVGQLLAQRSSVKAVVRSLDKLPEELRGDERLTVIQAAVLDLSDAELAELVAGCGAVASCLGHNITWKGLFGPPRRLVTDAVRRLCCAIQGSNSSRRVKFVLMNTAGNSNRDLREPVSLAQRCVIGLLRLCVPPLADNEQAADYLRTVIGQNDAAVEWVAVRPDALINEPKVSDYAVHPSPVRSAIFNPGKTSRINVAHFMTQLIADEESWNRWKGQMPVVYNREGTGTDKKST